MNIQLINQILDMTITGFIYAVEVWLGCALALYVINRNQKAADKKGVLVPVSTDRDRAADVGVSSDSEPVRNIEGAITIDITPSLDIAPSSVSHAAASKASGVECLVIKEHIVTAQPLPKRIADEPITFRPQQSAIDFAMLTPAVVELDDSDRDAAPCVDGTSDVQDIATVSCAIACEPVVWKLWKVADLRRASVAKSCGVRTRDKDSRRNLPKANLIAQYERSFEAIAEEGANKKLFSKSRNC